MRQADIVAKIIPPYKTFLEKKIIQYEAEQRRLAGREKLKGKFGRTGKDAETPAQTETPAEAPPAADIRDWIPAGDPLSDDV